MTVTLLAAGTVNREITAPVANLALLQTGKYTFSFTPTYSSASAPAWACLLGFDDGGNGGFIFNNASLQVWDSVANVERLGISLTWSANQTMTAIVDVPNKTITISGATTGNGTFTATTAWQWTGTNLYYGKDAFGDAFSGTIGDITLVDDITALYQGLGAPSYSTTTTNAVAYPSNIAAGDYLVTLVGLKSNTATCSTPSGWTLLANTSGGAGTTGSDTGPMAVYAFGKIAAGTESGTLSVTTSGQNVTEAQMFRFAKVKTTWDVAGAAGVDSSAGASFSATMGADPGITATDVVLGFGVIPTNVGAGAQFSAEAVSATGVSAWGSFLELSEPNSASGNHIGGFSFWGYANTGTSSAAPVLSATASGTTTNVAGPAALVRLRTTSTAITPTGVASAEAFGSDKLTLGVAASGIASAEAFGTAKTTLAVAPTGVASGETFGTAGVTTAGTIGPVGIASLEAFGSATVTANDSIQATGIASTQAFGSASIAQILAPTGIATAEAFGSDAIKLTVAATPANTGETFGAATVTAQGQIHPAGIGSSEAFGTATVATDPYTAVSFASYWQHPTGQNVAGPTYTAQARLAVWDKDHGELIVPVYSADGNIYLMVSTNHGGSFSYFTGTGSQPPGTLEMMGCRQDSTGAYHLVCASHNAGVDSAYYVRFTLTRDGSNNITGYTRAASLQLFGGAPGYFQNQVDVTLARDANNDECLFVGALVGTGAGSNPMSVKVQKTDTITPAATSDFTLISGSAGGGDTLFTSGVDTTTTKNPHEHVLQLAYNQSSAEVVAVWGHNYNEGYLDSDQNTDRIWYRRLQRSGMHGWAAATLQHYDQASSLGMGLRGIYESNDKVWLVTTTHDTANGSEGGDFSVDTINADGSYTHQAVSDPPSNSLAVVATFSSLVVKADNSRVIAWFGYEDYSLNQYEQWGVYESGAWKMYNSTPVNSAGDIFDMLGSSGNRDALAVLRVVGAAGAFSSTNIDIGAFYNTAERAISATAIASTEAFGSAKVVQGIAATGISSAGAFGSAALSQRLTATGIASAEAFGSDSVKLTVSPTGIASGQAFGTAALSSAVKPTGITSSEQFGTAKLVQSVAPTGIASAEAFGTPGVARAGQIVTTGIPSTEAFGAATVTASAVVAPAGIGSAEAFGSDALSQRLTAASVGPGEAFGAPSFAITAKPTGIASGEAFGAAKLSLSIAATGIASGEQFGAQTIKANATIAPTGIASGEAFGTAVVEKPGQILPASIPSAEAFGAPTVTALGVIAPAGIASAESFGTPVIAGAGVPVLQVIGIESDESFGRAFVYAVPDYMTDPALSGAKPKTYFLHG